MTDDQLLARPIVILGAPRSGTTLLSQLLKHHPDLYLANEPRIMWKYGNDSKSDALQPADARPEVVRHIRKQLAAEVRAAGRTRLVEKTPSNSLRLGFVQRVLPDAIYVHMMREGVESVLSIRKFWQQHATGVSGNTRKVFWRRLREMKLRQAPHYAREFVRRVSGKLMPGSGQRAVWGPRLPGIVEMARDMDTLEIAALQWRMCVEHTCRVGRQLPENRYTESQLCEFSLAELQSLLQFCHLSDSPEVTAEFHRKFDAKPASARSQDAELADVELVRQLIAPTNIWLKSLPPLARHRAASNPSEGNTTLN